MPLVNTQPRPAGPAGGTRVRFWGVRGSVPTPGPGTVIYGGNTSCIEVRSGDEIIILDAGTGLRPLGVALAAEFGQTPMRATLLLSHTHWDHIQGLPFFSPMYQSRNRFRILGYEGARNGLRSVLSSQMDMPYFPIGLKELPANLQIEELKDLAFTVGPVRVQAFYANHPGICVGYRLFTPQGSVAFFPDNELRRSPSGAAVSPAGGEDNPNRELIQFLRGTDLLIMDSQYDAVEYPEHVGWGHGCLNDVVSVALLAEVKHLVLFHHDPNHEDAKIQAMAECARRIVIDRKATLAVDAAREGAAIQLDGTAPS